MNWSVIGGVILTLFVAGCAVVGISEISRERTICHDHGMTYRYGRDGSSCIDPKGLMYAPSVIGEIR